MTIVWTDSYSVGDDDIDAQHQELFKLVNKFLNSSDKGSKTKCAMGMFKYTREHFKHEEDLMKKLRYPAMVAHIAEHNDLVSMLNGIAESIANDTLMLRDLEVFLSDWLVNHIGSSDTKLAAYVNLQN